MDLGNESVIRALKATRELLALRGGWVQGAEAADDGGIYVPWWSESARCFCLHGAITRAASASGMHYEATGEICRTIGTSEIASWNDDPDRTQADVLEAIDMTIARLGGVTP